MIINKRIGGVQNLGLRTRKQTSCYDPSSARRSSPSPPPRQARPHSPAFAQPQPSHHDHPREQHRTVRHDARAPDDDSPQNFCLDPLWLQSRGALARPDRGTLPT